MQWSRRRKHLHIYWKPTGSGNHTLSAFVAGIHFNSQLSRKLMVGLRLYLLCYFHTKRCNLSGSKGKARQEVQKPSFTTSKRWIMVIIYSPALTSYMSHSPRHYEQLKCTLANGWFFSVCVAGDSVCKTSHVAKFESLHSQLLNLCSASLSGSELSCHPLCSLFDLVHSWKLLPPSLTHSCVFEAGEHPHTHTTRDPGSWLVLNPWQGALSLNIKDQHLRACRHDSHPGLSDSQQATECPILWMW